MSIDLHTHTTASDGTLTPRELLNHASVQGVTVLAIADHDTVSSIDAATEYASQLRIELVPAIELNTEVNNTEIHILGYFINHNHDGLLARIRDLRDERLSRNEKMVARFVREGFDISIDDVLQCAKGETVGRPHIARALIRKGYFHTMQEIFENYLRPGCRAYEPRSRFTPEEAISLVNESGGFAVLAHPGFNSFTEDYIDSLVHAGLKGIEVFYPSHLPLQVDLYLKMALKKNLFVTGGSDFHGFDAMHFNSLGAPGYEKHYYGLMKSAHERRIKTGSE